MTMTDMIAPDSVQGIPFTALLCVEGLETCDGRLLDVGTTKWRETPIPFRVQDTSAHGEGQVPEPAWAAGQLDTIYRDPNDPTRILARGRLMPNETGARAEDLARHAFRGVSIDAYGDSPLPPEIQPKVVDQDGKPLSVLVRYTDKIISALTMVPISAFEACCLWFDDEVMPQIAMDAHGAVTDAEAPPEVMVVPNAYEQLVASAGGPSSPPRSWFFTPEPAHYQPMQVSAEGHVTGHLARAGQCHIGYVGKCETAPTSRTSPPFKAFHRTIARCEDATEVACGWIAMDTNHGDPTLRSQWSNGQTWDHYEHSGTLAAKVRASNGRYGTWLSGALLPGLSERQLAIVQGLSVSGHWHTFADPETNQRFGDELLGILGGVPRPGLPETRTRPELLVASETREVVGRIGNLDPCDCDGGDPMTPEESAEMDRLRAENEELRVLVASAGPTVSDLGRLLASMTPEQRVAALDALATSDEAAVQFRAGLEKALADIRPVTAASFSTAVAVRAAADAALVASADASLAQIEGRDLVDLTAPLSSAELARYVGRHDHDARTALAAQGEALHDGSVPITDERDLFDAIRHYGTNERIAGHLKRSAARLGRDDLASGEWARTVAFSQPA